MKNVIILHGTMGSPEGNWFTWLKSELEKQGLQAWLPRLPHAEQPSLREWADFVRTNCPFPIDEQALIVGHSSGSILALILAQENNTRIGKIVAVSVFHDNSLNWDANARLFDVALDWQKIRDYIQDVAFIHSDDDPYVPLDQAQYVANHCDAKLVMIPGQGHFNLEKSDRYHEFPKLLELI